MRERVAELYQKLETGVARFAHSDTWRAFLRFQAQFHRYSFNNCLLIWLQKPGATYVAGYNTWKKLGRYVKKGEKAIWILAPLIKKEVDEETGEEVQKIYGFRDVAVYDISQTDGQPVPELVHELRTDSEAGRQLYDALRQVIKIPVTEEEIRGGAKGYYVPLEHRIVLQKDLAVDQAAKTLCHEYVHSLLHHRDAEAVSSNVQECVAEGTAFVVASYFGLDTSDYSFGYVSSWSQGDAELIQSVGDQIQRTAERIIREVEGVLQRTEEAA